MTQPPGFNPHQHGPGPSGQSPPDATSFRRPAGLPPQGFGPPGSGPQGFAPQDPQGPQGFGPQGPQGFGPQGWNGPPQQGWPGQPLPAANLATHLKRAIDWNVAQVMVSPRERQALEAAGVHDRLQGLFAWRRSSLMVALPVLVLSVILGFVDAGQMDVDGYTGLGKLINWLPSIALIFVPIGCVSVIKGWTELRSTSRVLLICWLISIIVPMVCALAPVELLYDLDTLRQTGQLNGTSQQVEAAIGQARLLLAVQYALVLLPVVLSVPSGMLKGAARVKSLFPSSSLPGWFLTAVAPFYSMFVIVVFVLIDQLVGNGLLLIGVALLAFSPWLFVIYRNVYSRPLSLAEAKGELARASRLGGFVMLGAIFFIVVFLLTGDVDGVDVVGSGPPDSVFAVVDILRTIVEVLARSIVTAVVFSTIFLGMIFADWRTMQGTREDIRVEHQREMMALQRYISDPRRKSDALVPGVTAGPAMPAQGPQQGPFQGPFQGPHRGPQGPFGPNGPAPPPPRR